MNALDWTILWPACAAGLLITATHVPLGRQVLDRGIVFIDLAIAQIAGVGVVFANFIGLEPQGWAVQACALMAALGGALALTWTDKRWPEVQEATIGVTFILAASGALLLLAKNPHGGEHLRELLVGQILWVTPATLPIVAIVYALLLAFLASRHAKRGNAAFYVTFAIAVTISVQLVGLYLVFTTLIVPALATRRMHRHRLAAAYALSGVGYLLGLVVSSLTDLPTGPTIVWVMAALAVPVFLLGAIWLPDLGSNQGPAD
jgi:zinc/manganese transport system permease protein